MSGDRCPWAIQFGNIGTRCFLDSGHSGMHTGKGRAEFDYQRISWVPKDSREFRTDRDDEYAWEGPAC